MSKKNLFLLAAGYVAGGIITSLFSKKKPGEFKKALEKSREEGSGDVKVVVDNFVETHGNLIEELKKQVLSDENKKLFNEKKEELMKVVDVYKEEGLKIVDELKVKGKEFIVEASDNLEKLYEEKRQEIETLKEVAPEKAEELKEQLTETFGEVKEEIKKKMKK